MAQRILYLTYDGIMEPLGESQVLSYVRQLNRAKDIDISILSFEKKADLESNRFMTFRSRVHEERVEWFPLRYHKRPSLIATLYDVLCGVIQVRRLTPDVIHARSYVCALIALLAKFFWGIPFIFDMRGFWADERADTGAMAREGGLYRSIKWLERRFLVEAEHIVSLTQAAVRDIEGRDDIVWKKTPRFSVIPTCADLQRFHIPPTPIDPPCLGYVGSATTWYDFSKTALFFRAFRERWPHGRILIVNKGDHDLIRSELEMVGVSSYELRSAHHDEIAKIVQEMSFTVFFIRPFYSKTASAPTKWAEFLGCGIPCVTGVGIGDMDELIVKHRVGVLHRDNESVEETMDELFDLLEDPDCRRRCRSLAEALFSLEGGVEAYLRIYRSIAKSPSTP